MNKPLGSAAEAAKPLHTAQLAAIARDNGDESLATFLEERVAPGERDLLTRAEWYQLEQDDYWRPRVRRARLAAMLDRAAIWIVGAILAAVVAWCLAAWPDLLAADNAQPGWHDPAFDEQPVAP